VHQVVGRFPKPILAGLSFENCCLAESVDFWQTLPRTWRGRAFHPFENNAVPGSRATGLRTHPAPLPSEEGTAIFKNISSPESQGQNLALTVLDVPYSLDSGSQLPQSRGGLVFARTYHVNLTYHGNLRVTGVRARRRGGAGSHMKIA